ncbi:hypothetical protein ACFWFU_18770 [Streptomyces sp. NPDC060235]|uniref:hypothetical protein n=1 Tax=Streptomyces sp. NPDC060235 TaxID=3347080 RepID=UPI003651BF91
MAVAAASASTSATSDTADSQFTTRDAIFLAGIVGVAMAFVVGFAVPYFVTQRTYMKNQNEAFDQRIAAERELHAQAMESLKQASELATLMQLNQDQIKTYHDIVTEQADKSFKSSRAAMRIGLALLVCAAVGGAFVPLEQVRWFIGALAAFSTLLSGYLSKTYLSLYKESIGQLNRYFDQPVLNGYYLAAERLVGQLGEDHRDTVRKQVISEILENSARLSGRTVGETKQTGKPRPKKRVPKQQTAPVNGTPQA